MAALTFPGNQRANLYKMLFDQLRTIMDEDDSSVDQAFGKLCLSYLGFDEALGEFSDGSRDRGVDYWQVDENGCSIFQFKAQEIRSPLDLERRFGPDAISDVPRVVSLLHDLDNLHVDANNSVKKLLIKLRFELDRKILSRKSSDISFQINMYLCRLAGGFTEQAQQETLPYTHSELRYQDAVVKITLLTYFLDQLVAEQWHKTNSDWRTAEGNKDDRIKLQVAGGIISSSKTLVFFTKAYDLVEAFKKYGYQIFEPNVRCELKRSKVNQAIKASLKSSRGRREFKHLNNGLTLICSGFRKIGGKDVSGNFKVEIHQPGVINGLQTVKALYDTYQELSHKEKEEFIGSCEVLVRLHAREAVDDYTTLVKSTNNQNPMQPRNLRSNDPEQRIYESLFADSGWFYERKEGAWAAYKSDPGRWGTLRDKRANNFRTSRTGIVKSIDNHELAQAWLAFIGFSEEAIHNKREIFTDERYYDLVFMKRTIKHGFDYDFRFSDAAGEEHVLHEGPPADLMLTAFLCRELARELTPSRRKLRERAVERLRLSEKTTQEQEARLFEDTEFLKGLLLVGALYLFPEFVGFVLFRSLGQRVYEVGSKLLRGGSMKMVFEDRNFLMIKERHEQKTYSDDDLFNILWELYEHCLSVVVEGSSWRQQFAQAAVRSRFTYSHYNRKALFKELLDFDKVFGRRELTKTWTGGFERARGIFNFFEQSLGSSTARTQVVGLRRSA